MDYKINSKNIKSAASGRWFEILPLIDSRLTDACTANGLHVPCPAGTGSRDGFRMPLDANIDGYAYSNQLPPDALSDGFALLMWLNDWNFHQALSAVDAVISGSKIQESSQCAAPAAKTKDYTKKRAIFKRWLSESSEIPHEAATRYFINRGLYRAPIVRAKSIRYIDAIPCLHDGALIRNQDGTVFTTPAILCGMRSDGAVAGFNIIRIDEQGNKADEAIVEALKLERGAFDGRVNAKQLFSIRPMTGSCCRFGEVGTTWNAGEGFETMLAVAGALECSSVAATGTAALLETLEVPEHVTRLNIWADNDKSGRGLAAANKLKARYSATKDVFIHLPEAPQNKVISSVDWLDLQDDIKSYHQAHRVSTKTLIR